MFAWRCAVCIEPHLPSQQNLCICARALPALAFCIQTLHFYFHFVPFVTKSNILRTVTPFSPQPISEISSKIPCQDDATDSRSGMRTTMPVLQRLLNLPDKRLGRLCCDQDKLRNQEESTQIAFPLVSTTMLKGPGGHTTHTCSMSQYL